MPHPSRRRFLHTACGAVAVLAAPGQLRARPGGFPAAGPDEDAPPVEGGSPAPGARPRFGLVTYRWGARWELPQLIANLERAGLHGVELRTTHAHGVEPSLDAAERRAVRERFAASPVDLVGVGSDERFDHPDPGRLEQALDAAKAFVRLSHDVGSSGVKVKPNSFHETVPHEATIRQIGKALATLGEYAEDWGQEIRLEVHGDCAEPATIRRIVDIADHPAVRVCWNSNRQDLEGPGLESNFRLLRPSFGRTLHVRRLDSGGYPWDRLLELLVTSGWDGWVLLEEGRVPDDPAGELVRQRRLFDDLLARARRARESER